MTQQQQSINYDEQEHVYPQQIDYKAAFQENLSNSSLLLQIVKTIKIGTDMSSFASPVNFDSGVSALELTAEDLRPCDDMIGVYALQSAEERFLKVLYYLMSPLGTLPKPGLAPTKPFNPILGEEFNCHWNHADGSQTVAHLEQISHHPPILSGYFHNVQNNFAVELTQRPFPVFLGNKFEVTFSGVARVHLFLPPTSVEQEEGIRETYDFVRPSLCGKGLFIGKGCFEVNRELKLSCARTGLEAVIQFKSGSVVKGKIKQKSEKNSKPVRIYDIDGSILNQVFLTDLRLKQKRVFYDMIATEHLHKIVKPVSKQKDNESRRVWHGVTYNIRTKNLDLAGQLKKEIEEEQRQKAKKNKDVTYTPQHFRPTNESESKVQFYVYNKPITRYHAPIVQEKVEDDLD